MNIRLPILLSCLLIPACYGMESFPAPMPTEIVKESIDQVFWHMRGQLARKTAATIKDQAIREMMAYPMASDAIQALWTEAQTRMDIPRTEQKPLRLKDDDAYEFSTLYGISTISPIATTGINMLPQLYGYIRYSLLHEGAHIHTSNVDHANELITGYVLSSLTDHEVMTIYTQAVKAHFTNVVDLYQRFFISNPAAQRLQAEEAHRVEHETDMIMLAHTDCEQCMHEYIRFVSGVNQQRISEGYVGLHELTQRAHELAGKRCKWHAKQK